MKNTKQFLIGIIIFSFLAVVSLQAQNSLSSFDNDKYKLIVQISSEDELFHCEVPCGIYNDKVRITLIKEHITTIEKSMTLISELSKEEKTNYNQLVRWITTKEKHANKIQEIVSQYFLHQRIKITKLDDKKAYEKYHKQLELLHHISVNAMKTKQSIDLSVIKTIQGKVEDFEHIYFADHDHKH